MLSGSSLAISGNSANDKDTIYYKTNDSNSAINCSSGSLEISGTPLIHSISRCVSISGSCSFSMSGGYLYSEKDIAFRKGGTGSANISNTWIYTPCANEWAIYDDGSGDITINDSNLGNGSSSTLGHNTSNEKRCPTCRFGNGQISFVGTYVMAGEYASSAILIAGTSTLSCTGNTRVFCNNTEYHCIGANSGTVTINSTGLFYSRGKYVLYTEKDPTIQILKGHFASTSKDLIAKYNGKLTNLLTHKSNPTERILYSMTGYKTKSSKSFNGTWYYCGVNV